jgi:hypothetical protein
VRQEIGDRLLFSPTSSASPEICAAKTIARQQIPRPSVGVKVGTVPQLTLTFSRPGFVIPMMITIIT